MSDAEVTEALAKSTLEACVKALFSMSWNEARRAIASGKVQVGDKRTLDNLSVPGFGAVIRFTHNAPKPQKPIDLQVVFEDDHVIVVNKPSGLMTIPYDDTKADTLDARVREYLTQTKKAPKNVRPELGVVHRIDKETSGLVVFTRTWAAKQSLAEQFRVHSVHRRYLAIVQGKPRNETISTQIARDRGDGLRGSVKRGGERAVTHVEVLQSFAQVSLVACRLETGRTHQIRIHLSERGCPVAGDKVYGKDGVRAPRLMLHAKELGFSHPKTQEQVQFDAELPRDMQSMLSQQR